MSPSDLSFDESTHTYRYQGVVVVSVTKVLDGWSNMDRLPADVLYAAGRRGSLVHEATELDDEGDLNEAWADEVGVMGYVTAWRRFRREHEFEPTLIEAPVFHAVNRYAGRLDRFGVMLWPYKRTRRREETLIDIKSGAGNPTHPLQTAAYGAAMGHRGRRLCVYLNEDGYYIATEHANLYADLADWLSCLRHFRWRQRNNLG